MTGKLNARGIQFLKPGKHGDGGGLYLEVDEKLNRKWIYRFSLNGHRREMGLSTWPDTSLKEAREGAQEARRLVARRVDPIEARKSSVRLVEAIPTFQQIAKQVVAEAKARTVSDKVQFQWELHLGERYCKSLLALSVHEIKTRDILNVLNPVFREKPETGRKLHRAIRKVFDHARVILRDQHGIELGQNPADLRDLKALGLIDPEKLRRGKHASLPYPQAPAFMKALSLINTVSALGLQILILTNVRTRSLRLAEWTEFDLDQKVWAIPRGHLKDGKHRIEGFKVPLSDQTVDLLVKLKELQKDQFVMPSQKSGVPCSDGLFLALIKRMNENGSPWMDPRRKTPITAHGFRSTFRTWSEEEAEYPREVIEECMGHSIGNAIERSYRDTDALKRRQRLMQDWANYLNST
jgi:integrase